ncbi:MAG: metal-dependent hydrolase [Acidobacteria bacterium]|nr:metal-dependent hydrolase [Acidobacteriota bacterium]
MPTPVGHALAGLAIYASGRRPRLREDWPFAAAVVGSALLPDVDFVLGFFVGRNLHHHFTHSLGATAFYFLACLGPCGLGRSGWLTFAYASHLLLDLFSKDTAPPFGIQLLWPVSAGFYISPVLVFDDVWRGSLAMLFGWHNWLAVGREVLLLGPLAALAWRWRARYVR